MPVVNVSIIYLPWLQLIQWDIAVEKDTINEEEEEIPPQLLFVHQVRMHFIIYKAVLCGVGKEVSGIPVKFRLFILQ